MRLFDAPFLRPITTQTMKKNTNFSEFKFDDISVEITTWDPESPKRQELIYERSAPPPLLYSTIPLKTQMFSREATSTYVLAVVGDTE